MVFTARNPTGVTLRYVENNSICYVYIYIFFHSPLRVDARKKKKKTFEDTTLNINPLTIPFFSRVILINL